MSGNESHHVERILLRVSFYTRHALSNGAIVHTILKPKRLLPGDNLAHSALQKYIRGTFERDPNSHAREIRHIDA